MNRSEKKNTFLLKYRRQQNEFWSRLISWEMIESDKIALFLRLLDMAIEKYLLLTMRLHHRHWPFREWFSSYQWMIISSSSQAGKTQLWLLAIASNQQQRSTSIGCFSSMAEFQLFLFPSHWIARRTRYHLSVVIALRWSISLSENRSTCTVLVNKLLRSSPYFYSLIHCIQWYSINRPSTCRTELLLTRKILELS